LGRWSSENSDGFGSYKLFLGHRWGTKIGSLSSGKYFLDFFAF
jgi:hypothetical protein